MPGAPVIELEYIFVLEKVLLVTVAQTGVAPRHVNLVPKTIVLGVGFFILCKNISGGIKMLDIVVWKKPAIYLTSVGIANIGGWIYLLALNLLVLERTGSILAVAGLYIIKPFASLLTSLWAGSIIDRVSTKYVMITLECVRAFLVCLLLVVDSIFIIYLIVLFIQVASVIFDTSAFTYMTKLISVNRRKRFNAIYSFIQSGAFITGPLVAGLLFLTMPLESSLLVNVFIFLISGALLLPLPNLHGNQTSSLKRLSLKSLVEDWRSVWTFSLKALPFLLIYMAFQGVMLLTAAIDSLEVSFAKEVLHLTDASYGALVSIAGLGYFLGAISLNFIVHRLSANQLMIVGTFFVSVGYCIYSISDSYSLASAGFFTLSFFLSLSHTGFLTFIQERIPEDMLGRITNLYNGGSSIVQILAIVLLSGLAFFFSIRTAIILGAICMLFISVFIGKFSLRANFSRERA